MKLVFWMLVNQEITILRNIIIHTSKSNPVGVVIKACGRSKK